MVLAWSCTSSQGLHALETARLTHAIARGGRMRLARPLRALLRSAARASAQGPSPSFVAEFRPVGGRSATPSLRASTRCFASKAAGVDARSSTAQDANDYDASAIQVLEGLEPVRKRPGMYIGSTSQKGLHHLVSEVVDNSIDECQAGHATAVSVDLEPGGWVSVMDDGRGIPTDIHPRTGKSALETVLTVLHAGGKFGGDASGYSVSGGLHGVGLSVVNALSETCEVTVWRDGLEHKQRFHRGIPEAPMATGPQQLAPGAAPRRGTRVRFLADSKIFPGGVLMERAALTSRLRELAFLNAGVAISISGSHEKDKSQATAPPKEEFTFPGGIAEYLGWLTRDSTPLTDVFTFTKRSEGVEVNVALRWVLDGYSDTLLGYANSIRTSDGGTHLDGFKAALTRVVNSLAKKYKLLKDGDGASSGDRIAGDYIREGLTAVVSVRLATPEFEGQTKTRLGNQEVRRAVDAVVADEVTVALEMHPQALEKIVQKALDSLAAAEAAKRAREVVRRKSALRASALPGKLADCATDSPADSEIFLVEGDSAGGSTKQGRDRKTQAVLPLRGKILNVERVDDTILYKNQEITNLIQALGLGVKGEPFNEKTLRYHKIIILTDADVDGAHIRTLLLTFFFRYQRSLFERGFVYVGVPPLYKVSHGRNKAEYCYDEAELRAFLATLPKGQEYNIQRFKGLGEMMPQQLWETTLDPARRRLRRMTIEDVVAANDTFVMLMSGQVGPRREFIEREGPRLGLSIDI